MNRYEQASRVERTSDTTFELDIPDGWQMGRGTFGGLVIGVLLRAIEASEPEKTRRTRTILADICGPVQGGRGEIVVSVLRRGANQSNIRADLKQNGETLAFASAVLSTPRSPGLESHRPRVEVPDIAAALAVPNDAPMMPTFLKNFTLTVKSGIPFTSSAEPTVEAWVRLAEAPTSIDAPLLVAYLDSFWPATYAAWPMPRPTATISFTAEIARDPAKLDPSAPLFYRARTVFDEEGFQLEYRELFDLAGDLVASNQQTFCIIK